MNREDIIRMAREAGFADGIAEFIGLSAFDRFAALVASAEREACAREIEIPYYGEGGQECAAAIRARGDKHD